MPSYLKNTDENHTPNLDSGVFIMGEYEVQVLDYYENKGFLTKVLLSGIRSTPPALLGCVGIVVGVVSRYLGFGFPESHVHQLFKLFGLLGILLGEVGLFHQILLKIEELKVSCFEIAEEFVVA